MVQIESPTINSQVTYLTDVAISVTGDDVFEWKLEYSLKDANVWVEFASGTGEVANEVVGTFDPTILQNDLYDLRATAVDISGNQATSQIFIGVEGQAKLGNYALEFTDLNVPLAGIPIQITRQYDTLNAHESGDFGYGWRLAIGEANIRETVPVSDLELAGVPPIFGGSQGLFEGSRVEDRNGVTLEYRDDGIFSSTGESIEFVRDAQGRITSIIDPLGNAIEYEYDANGDLVKQSSPADCGCAGGSSLLESTMTYSSDRAHFLETVSGPRGNIINQVKYDDDGRVIGIFDALGNEIVQEYDLENNAFSQTDALGNRTELTFDNRGNITEIVDANGNTSSATYDDPRNAHLETSVSR